MKPLQLIIIFALFTSDIFTQNLKFFNKLPSELSGDFGQARYFKISTDSQYIYVIGDVKQNLLGHPRDIIPVVGVFTYDGNLMKRINILDTLIRENPYWNEPIYLINDSICIIEVFGENYNKPSMKYFNKFNLRNGTFDDRIKVKIELDSVFSNFSEGILKDGELVLSLKQYDKVNSSIIFEFDTSMNVLRIIKIPINKSYQLDRYITKGNNVTYNIISEFVETVNQSKYGTGYLFYTKLDTFGRVLKTKKLNMPGNFYIAGGETYTIILNSNNTYTIFGNDRGNFKIHYDDIFYFVNVSAEFDTIHWITKFDIFDNKSVDSEQRMDINYMTKMTDGSYVVGGNMNDPSFDKPDYAFLLKCGANGDSLWMRKYHPTEWTIDQAIWMRFFQVKATPYNTIVAAGEAVDREYYHGWLVHFDEHGCVVPGCEKIVSTKEIYEGKVKAFELFPNPVISDKIYLLSRINTKEDARISIIDLQGKEIKSMKLKLEASVQYFIPVPEEIPSGEYIFKIESKEYVIHEKIIIN